MKNIGLKTLSKLGLTAVLFIGAYASQAATLSGVAEYSTDSSGNFYNGSIWSTHNDPYWIVKAWVIHSANLQGPFVNGPSASQANISIPLSDGEHSFVFFANRGGFTPHHGLNLFFNGDNNTPRISVFGATQTSPNSVPPFSANGGNTVTIAAAPVPGANTLVFQDTNSRIELIDYRFADTSVYNLDRVSQLSTSPDGGTDFIGQFTLRVTNTDPPDPPPAIVLDVESDYSTNQNPGTVWSYGWKPTLDGAFTLLPYPLIQSYGPGRLIHRWLKPGAGSPPSVNKHIGTVTHDDGEGVYPPGVVWFGPGDGGERFGVIRCTIPAAGTYRLETAVRTYLEGPISGDCDFHVVKNGAELFGQFMPGTSSTGYSNTLDLAAGDIIDFAVGRGADNSSYASGLKIQARLERSGNEPPPPPPPTLTLDVEQDYSTNENPGTVWSYGWKPTLDGAFTLLPYPLIQSYGPGRLIHRWLKPGAGSPPSVNKHIGTVTHDDGEGVYPPGVVWFGPGDGNERFGVIRCRIPTAGTYRLETAVRTYLEGAVAGDCDFHVVKNGAELFGQFMPARSATGYSNTLDLAAGDIIDFAVGRGADDSSYASGLKIQARLERTGDGPPPPAVTFDVSTDFSITANPNGPWSFGWLGTLNGPFGLLSFPKTFAADNGVPVAGWFLSSTEIPGVVKNVGNTTAVSDGGNFTGPPGTVWFSAGADGAPQNFGVIRFTVPAGGDGDYRIETAVQSLFDGTRSQDADFHVLKDGQELFGQFMPPNSATGYSNTVHLSAGSTIDFAVGRGADGLIAHSGLKIKATLTGMDIPPPPPPPPASTFDVSQDFSIASNPNGAWSYGWLSTLNGPFGLLSFPKTFPADNGVPVAGWFLSSTEIPGVVKNVGNTTAVSDGGNFVGPPGTVWFSAGADGAPQNFGVIRFTVPAGGDGDYRIETAVQSLFDGTRSQDADFHVLKDGQELFGQFMPPNSATGYSNTVHLSAGSTIDFAVGRGADGLIAHSGLKIKARLTRGDIPPPPPPPTGLTLSGLLEFSTDANGNFYNGSVWNTRGGDTAVNLWVAKGTDLHAPFVNGPSDAQAGIAIELQPGVNEFVIFGNQGGPTPHHGLNLFFNGNNNTPRISVFGPTQTSTNPPFPGFSANSSPSTLTLAFNPVPGAGTLVYQEGTTRVELTHYRWANPFVYNIDRVSQPVATPDGGPDFIGRFTLNVTTGEPPPPPPPPPDCSPVRSGLIAWWRGEGNAEDSVGSNHGQLHGETSFVPGKVGQGFRFDGVNDFVLVPDHASLDLVNEITMEMWFNSEEWGEGRTWALLDKRGWNDCNYGAVVSVPWGFQLYYNDPHVFGGDHPGNMFEISSYYPIPTTHEFHHFAGTFRQVDPSHIELKTYLDGALVRTRVFSGNLANTVNDMPVAIGSARGGADGGAFRGIIDEVSLYNRALSEDEIHAIYRASSTGKCPEVPLTITVQPHSQVVAAGATVTLSVSASGTPPLSYQWLFNGAEISGATSSTLTLADFQAEHAGRYSVRVSNSAGSVTSAEATLRIFVPPPPPTGLTLSGLLEFSTDANGNFYNGSVWNTRGGDTAVNLWVAKGTEFDAPFVNGPSDAQAGVAIQLHAGVNEFVIFGNQGGPTPHHGLNLFLNGDNNTPRISVFGPTQTSPNQPYPAFAANGSPSTLTLAFNPVPGAGTLVYQQGTTRVELTHYRWADPFVYNIDRVSQPVATPDGGPDFIGRFTLNVTTGEPPPPPPTNCAPAGHGLVAWWRGEGNASDSVGSNHGQLQGSTSFAPGKVGQGFLFDGDDDFILVPDSPSLDLTQEITMEMWFNSQEWGQGRTWALMDKRTYNDCNYGAVVSEPWGFQLYYNDPNVFGGDHPGNIFEISAHFPLPSKGVFHHFAGTFRQVDATHIELKTYLDGALVETRLFSGSLANTVNDMPLAIGAARGGADGGAFRGIIDEVSLYNRALTADEVAAIYAAGSAGKCPPTHENSPPSAHIALSPQFTIEGAPHPFVIACDGQVAKIVLDARGSTDPDGDPLSYAWFAAGSQRPFSTASVTSNSADIGLYSVTLVVSDAESSANATLVFEVITPAEAAAQLSLLLDSANVGRKAKHPLQASLRSAIESLEEGNLKSAIGKLGAFDNKVKAQLAATHPGLAASLCAATEALIEVLEDCPKDNGGED